MRLTSLTFAACIGFSVVLSGCAGAPSAHSSAGDSAQGGPIVEIPRIYKALALSSQCWPLRGGQRWVYRYTRSLRRPRAGAPDTVSNRVDGMDTLRVENYLEDGRTTQVFLRDPNGRAAGVGDVTWVYTMRDSSVTLPGTTGTGVELFRFPLKEGARFGHDPSEPVQGDLLTWVVAGEEVATTPSGRYRAWRLDYDTVAFTLSRWFVPGLGIVAEERHPHKGGYDYRAELVSH